MDIHQQKLKETAELRERLRLRQERLESDKPYRELTDLLEVARWRGDVGPFLFYSQARLLLEEGKLAVTFQPSGELVFQVVPNTTSQEK